MTELNLVLSDLSLAISNVEKWMSPEYVAKDLVNRFNTAFIQPEPYGVVLIISPWNYPLLLTLQPLVGVIAAGNVLIMIICCLTRITLLHVLPRLWEGAVGGGG